MILDKTLIGRLFRSTLLLTIFALVLTACTLPAQEEPVEVSQASGAPVVQFASPLPNTTYLAGVPVIIQLRVTNAGTDIDRVEISVDDIVIATLPSPNPSGDYLFTVTQTWESDVAGNYAISAVAYREDGSSSNPSSVMVNIVSEIPNTGGQSAPSATPTTVTVASPVPTTVQATSTPTGVPTEAPTQAPAVTNTPVAPEATATSSVPIARSEGVNIRRGPSTNFEPPLGVLGPGMEAEVLAYNLAGDWIKIRYNGTSEGWVFVSLTQIEGNTSGLPREAGPPIPTLPPATATPIPAATNPPAAGANLVITGFELDPRDPFCNQNAKAFVNVANTGSAATGAGTTVVFISVDAADGQSDFLSVSAPIPSIEPGANFLVQINYVDSSGGAKAKRAVAVVDPDRQIPETNDNDNTSNSIEYVLGVPPNC